jgi:selenide,water dikinase
VTALAIAGFPEDTLDTETIRQIFRGGVDTLREAGVALLGGHTVRDREVKFGYAVTGAVDPQRMWTNAGARVGDVLLLTKALGTGIVGTAIKFGRAPENLVVEAVASMSALNKDAAGALASLDVHACTDITGFGLAGHGTEMAVASGVTLALQAAKIPQFSGVQALAAANRSGGMSSNRAHFAQSVAFESPAAEALADLVFDPQTSGGLLVALAPGDAGTAMGRLEAAGVRAVVIGAVCPQQARAVEIR